MKNTIPKKIYDEIKTDYLSKKEKSSILYRKYHKTYNINKIQFSKILEKINEEENIPQKIETKVKRMQNPFSFHDKHPDSYFKLTYMVS